MKKRRDSARRTRPGILLRARKGLFGVTLTELLAVLVIVAILATLAVPAAIRRNAQAKVSVARSETETLAKAEEMCAVTHGFFVPLQMLNDLPIDIQTRDPDSNDLQSEFGRGLLLIDVNTQLLTQQTGGQVVFQDASPDPRVREMIRTWAGPFADFHRYFIGGNFTSTGGTQPTQLSLDQIARDFPLDPWGNPYRLYSPMGITGQTIGVTTPIASINQIDNDTFSNGQLTNTDDRFDRFAVVSFGPDSISDRTTTSGAVSGLTVLGDDIIYQFGAISQRTETDFTIVLPGP